MKISIGDRFGELVIIKKLDKKWNNYNRWLCKCDCGNTTNTNTYSLKKGVINCGKRLGHIENILNKKYGYLTVKKRIGNLWLCKCNCGKEIIVEKRKLMHKHIGIKNCGCLSKIDLVGKNFGYLKVLRLATDKIGANRALVWECSCKCGRIVYPSTTRLKKGYAKDCGYCKKFNLEGKKFGKLTVLKILQKNKHSNRVYECLCECGKKIKVISSSLRNGATSSCGCNRNKYIDKTILIKNIIYKRYKRRAFKRNLEFKLTRDEFNTLIKKRCFYCGDSPNNEIIIKDTAFKYSGIDRIKNNKGYVNENCASCCARCNLAKGKLPYKEFIKWTIRISNYVKLNRKTISQINCY